MRGRQISGIAATACLALTLLEPGCSSSGDEVRQAIKARFPGGLHRCIGLDPTVFGLHVPARIDETITYGPNALIGATRHLFVFYAGPADQPLPELAALLLDQGVLTKHVLGATSDTQTTGYGPPQLSGGFVHRADTYQHDVRRFQVVVLTTKAQDPRFRFNTLWSTRTQSSNVPTFPVRLDTGDLPPADTHYVLPTVSPYAVSAVDGACTAETISSVSSMEQRDTPGGVSYVVARVTLAQTPPDYMATPTFRRAVGGLDEAALSQPLPAELVFQRGPHGLTYVSGAEP